MTILYFSDTSDFGMIRCSVTDGDEAMKIGYEDVQMIYFGTWSRAGSTIHVRYKLLYRALPHLGDDPTQRQENFAIQHGVIAFHGHTFRREARLDSIAVSTISEFDTRPTSRAVRP